MSDPREDVLVCRCEELSRADIVAAVREGAKSLNTVKRVTRAGMGLCQGRSCQRAVSAILSEELGCDPGTLLPLSVRPPLRPVAIGTLVSREGRGCAKDS